MQENMLLFEFQICFEGQTRVRSNYCRISFHITESTASFLNFCHFQVVCYWIIDWGAIFKSYALQMIVLAEFVKIDVHEIFVWYAKINVPKKQFFYIPQKINKQKISQISRCFVWERNWLLLKLCEILVLIPFNAVSFQTHSVKIYLLVMNTSTWQRSFLEDFFIQCLI